LSEDNIALCPQLLSDKAGELSLDNPTVNEPTRQATRATAGYDSISSIR
jgi:hypothetical protein